MAGVTGLVAETFCWRLTPAAGDDAIRLEDDGAGGSLIVAVATVLYAILSNATKVTRRLSAASGVVAVLLKVTVRRTDI